MSEYTYAKSSDRDLIATPHPLASAAGRAVLNDGGSAVDAVIAANAGLTVVAPDQTAIGGDMFMMVYDAGDGSVRGLNGSGRAPKAADPEALLAGGATTVPVRGPLAVTVPGTIDGWTTAHARWGRLSLDRLVAPAVAAARDGFEVSPMLALSFQETLGAGLPWMDAIWRLFAPEGRIPVAGDTLRNPDLAVSFERIAAEGRDLVYAGELAERIVGAVSELGGWLALDDLAEHVTEEVAPVATSYRDVTVLEMPPNSQGITASLALTMIQQEELGRWGSADHLHPLIEAKKLAFAVRDANIGDPAVVSVDSKLLSSQRYARSLWASYDPARAGIGQPSAGADTVYLCAMDRDGNAASLIQSLYQSFGSGVVVEGTGIVLQNRGTYFTLEEGHPNRLEGGKRPLHTLMPGMLMRGERLWGPFGTQGGDAQAQVHIQLVTDLVDFRMTPAEAIDAPRWVAGACTVPDPFLVMLEGRFERETIEGLAARGHNVVASADWDPHAGHAQTILRDEDGTLSGAADRRSSGSVL